MTTPPPTPPTPPEIAAQLDDLQNALHDYEADIARGVARPLVGPLNRARAALLSSVSALAERAAAAERERDAQGEMAVGYRSSWLSEENKRFAAETRAAQAEAERDEARKRGQFEASEAGSAKETIAALREQLDTAAHRLSEAEDAVAASESSERELRGALRGCLAYLWPAPEEGHTGFVDRLGMEFYRETWIWPPFKSAPMEVHTGDAEEARKKWTAWLEAKRDAAAKAAAALVDPVNAEKKEG